MAAGKLFIISFAILGPESTYVSLSTYSLIIWLIVLWLDNSIPFMVVIIAQSGDIILANFSIISRMTDDGIASIITLQSYNFSKSSIPVMFSFN